MHEKLHAREVSMSNLITSHNNNYVSQNTYNKLSVQTKNNFLPNREVSNINYIQTSAIHTSCLCNWMLPSSQCPEPSTEDQL